MKKFLFIHTFLREFFIRKVVENSPQNARNCTIFKNFLGGACPQTPLATARSFAARDIKIPKNFRVGPPPLRNPAYAPVKPRTICMGLSIKGLTHLRWFYFYYLTIYLVSYAFLKHCNYCLLTAVSTLYRQPCCIADDMLVDGLALVKNNRGTQLTCVIDALQQING